MSVQKFNPKISYQEIPYAQINTHVIQNIKNLDAGFLWCYLQSKPEKWKVIQSHLQSHFGFGITKMKKILAFLNQSKLIRYYQPVDKFGKFKNSEDIQVLNGSEFVIIQEDDSAVCKTVPPVINRSMKTRSMQNRAYGKQHTINNRDLKIKERSKTREQGVAKIATEKPSLFSKDYNPKPEHIALADKRRLDFTKAYVKFVAFYADRKLAEANWDIELTKWLNNEKKPTAQTTSRITSAGTPNEVRSHVKDWHDPTHPRFEQERFDKEEKKQRRIESDLRDIERNKNTPKNQSRKESLNDKKIQCPVSH